MILCRYETSPIHAESYTIAAFAERGAYLKKSSGSPRSGYWSGVCSLHIFLNLFQGLELVV